MNENKIHFEFLDALRGVAILMVFLFHSLGAVFGFDSLPWDGLFRNYDVTSYFLVLYPATYGHAGVAVFFVISGFCIHMSYEKSKDKSWWVFAQKRIFRIIPPYFFALVVFFFVWPWGSFDFLNSARVAQFLAHILLIHNFHPDTIFSINPSFWSIAIEVQLYLLYPVLFWMAGKLGWRRAMFVVFGIEVLCRLSPLLGRVMFDVSMPYFVAKTPFAYWMSWAMGAYLFQCYAEGKSSRLFSIPVWLIAFIAVAVPQIRYLSIFTFPVFSLLTGVIIDKFIWSRWSCRKSQIVRGIEKHMVGLGVFSYSFYLIHQPFLTVMRRIFERSPDFIEGNPVVKYLLCMMVYPVVYFISKYMYKYIESGSVRIGAFLRLKGGLR